MQIALDIKTGQGYLFDGNFLTAVSEYLATLGIQAHSETLCVDAFDNIAVRDDSVVVTDGNDYVAILIVGGHADVFIQGAE